MNVVDPREVIQRVQEAISDRLNPRQILEEVFQEVVREEGRININEEQVRRDLEYVVEEERRTKLIELNAQILQQYQEAQNKQRQEETSKLNARIQQQYQDALELDAEIQRQANLIELNALSERLQRDYLEQERRENLAELYALQGGSLPEEEEEPEIQEMAAMMSTQDEDILRRVIETPRRAHEREPEEQGPSEPIDNDDIPFAVPNVLKT